jgi:hypothetical protein
MAGRSARGTGNREEQRDFGVDQGKCEPNARCCQQKTGDFDFLLLRGLRSGWVCGTAYGQSQCPSADRANACDY